MSVFMNEISGCERFMMMTSPQASEDGLDFVDESEEWAKIERVMASLDTGFSGDAVELEDGIKDILEGRDAFGGIRKDLYPGNGETHTINATSFATYDRALPQWLTSLDLSKYEHFLITNGFDDLRFMGPEIMSDADLQEIGITDDEDRAVLLRAASQLDGPTTRKNKSGADPTFKSVKEWLRCLGLMDYYETFVIHGCTQADHLLNIWDLQLTSVFHISRSGHRNRIMASINDFRSKVQRTLAKNSKADHSKPIVNGCLGGVENGLSTTPSSSNSSSSNNNNNNNICLNDYLLHRQIFTNFGGHPGEVSLFKDYSSLKSNKSGRSSTSSTLRRQASSKDESADNSSQVITLEEVLRNCGVVELPAATSPQPLSSSSLPVAATATSSSTPACIASNKINSNSCSDAVSNNLQHVQYDQSNFSVIYLGSVKLPFIDKPDLARKCIGQIRLSPVESRRVVISVCPERVVFKDQVSQELLGAHDVSNVFCVCQDVEQLEYFAFVTWDVVESVHFCHVFNAQYLQLSTDVVLSLGKAFEVAFQLIQQEGIKQNGRSIPPPPPPSSSSSSHQKYNIAKISTFV